MPDPAALRNVCIKSEGIKTLLQNLKADKAASLNEIWPKVLIELAPIMAPVLQVLFIRSHSPNDWKTVMINPVFKKGDKDSPNNYRPISLTCICSKLMEHIFTTCMMSHLMSTTSYTTYSITFCRVVPMKHTGTTDY